MGMVYIPDSRFPAYVMNVPPQDHADFLRLVARLEKMSVSSGIQASVRSELLAKLRRYEVTPSAGTFASSSSDPARQRNTGK